MCPLAVHKAQETCPHVPPAVCPIQRHARRMAHLARADMCGVPAASQRLTLGGVGKELLNLR